jgi:hypothetical protein
VQEAVALLAGVYMAKNAEVIDFRQHQKSNLSTICRLLPEQDGIEMLYSNDSSDQIFSLKVLCWAIWSDGHIDAMVPWLNRVVPCRTLNDPLNGHWEGFLDPITGEILFEAPKYKAEYLTSSAQFYPKTSNDPQAIVQEIPDIIGSHALFSSDQFDSFTMREIHSWRLYNDGSLLAMAVEEEDVHSTPVLPGDDCLFSVQHRKDFHYFFQHSIANKIKARDPDALAAMAHLSEHSSK